MVFVHEFGNTICIVPVRLAADSLYIATFVYSRTELLDCDKAPDKSSAVTGAAVPIPTLSHPLLYIWEA